MRYPIVQIWLFFLLGFRGAHAGSLPSYQLTKITTKEGLSNNIVLDIFQDSKGYVWFGTLSGLVKYEGARMTEYGGNTGLRNGLKASIIECVYEAKDGSIWIGSRVHGLSKRGRQENTWVTYKFGEQTYAVTHVQEDKQGNLVFCTRSGYLIKLAPQGKIDTLFYSTNPIDEFFIDITGSLVVFSENRIWKVSSKVLKPYAEKNGQRILALAYNGLGNFVYADTNGVYLGYQIKQGKFPIHQLSGRIPLLGMSNIGNALVWDAGWLYVYGFTGQLLSKFNLGKTYPWLLQTHLNKIYQSKDGVIWLATDMGVCKITENEYPFVTVKVEESMLRNHIRGVHVVGPNTLLIGCFKAQAVYQLIFSGDTIKKKIAIPLVTKYKEPLNINTFLTCKNGDVLVGTEAGIYVIKKGTKEAIVYAPESLKKVQEVWSLFEDGLGRIWIGTNKLGLFIFNPTTSQVVQYVLKGNTLLSIWTIQEMESGNLYLGSNNGLWAVVNSNSSPRFKRIVKDSQQQPLLGNHVWQLLEHNHKIWVGTTDEGLSFIDETGLIKHSGNELPFDYKQVSGLLADGKKNVWVSTMDGIYCIRENKTTLRFTEEDGLPGNDFNFKACAKMPNGNFCLGTKTGLCYFNPATILTKFRKPEKVLISTIGVVGEEDVVAPENNELLLKHEQNHFTIKFFCPDYRNEYRVQYRYKMENLDHTWRYTDNKMPEVYYAGIAVGDYHFKVQATLKGCSWPDDTTILFVQVVPPFWKKWWFVTLIFLLGTVLTVVFIQIRMRHLIKQRTEKSNFTKKVAELELKALQAQMNPHFIFNAINSIQHYIINQHEREANSYLSKFSKLMRLFLESSKNKVIPLTQEIELIGLYLELEKLRFNDKMNYRIEVATNVSANTTDIPSMLIQPFIENAINHGISPLLDRMGLLIVSFTVEGNTLKVCIDDNGIGIKMSKALQQQYLHTHKSRGVEIISERINLLQKLEDRSVKINTFEKQDEIGNPCGTRVEILITIIYD